MACLQFLSGARDQEVQELSEAGALTVGSAAGAHIPIRDPGVAEQHCKIYSAQGGWWLQNLNPDTVLGKARVPPNEIRQLPDRTVFIVGSVFVKFWSKRPPAGGPSGSGAVAGGAGSGTGVDPAALEQLKKELADARSELERNRAQGGQADSARREADEQRRAAESAQLQARELEGKLAELKKQLAAESKAREEAEGKRHALEGELTRARAEAESKVSEAERKAKEEVEREKRAAEARAEEAQKAAEGELSKAREALQREQEELRAALAADRAACEALRAREEALNHDRLAALRQGSDLARALEALELPEALRRRLEAAIAAEVDREALRRVSGPVVPLRGLRLPGSDRDIESELRAARRQSEQAELARRLGLHELEPAELERLLEAARA